MAGSLSSLGIGSNVLTSDVIDKLKANDTNLIVKPIENKITMETQKKQALALLNSLLSSFKSSVDALSNDTLYQARSVSGSNSNVSVTANSGVNIQSFSISNTDMALNDIKQSGSFTSATSTVASGAGTMTLSSGGLTFGINYTAAMTLDELKDAINAQAGDKVKASTLQVGTNQYSLVLRSVDTGLDQAITITDSVGGTLDTKLLPYDVATNPTGMQGIQAAKDATFKYNGITLTRSSNTITDIIPGVTINLLQTNLTGSTANIAITQNVDAVASEMSSLVQSYNTLTSQITEMTGLNEEKKTVGIFNGNNDINAINREVIRTMTSVSIKGGSLAQYGIDLDEFGVMSFKSSTFTAKFTSDPTASSTFFSNVASDTTTENGIFTRLESLMTRLTGSKGTMTTLTNGSDAELKSLKANKLRSIDMLEARYLTMAARFAAYDSIISKVNGQFSSLQQQIQMAVNGKN